MPMNYIAVATIIFVASLFIPRRFCNLTAHLAVACILCVTLAAPFILDGWIRAERETLTLALMIPVAVGFGLLFGETWRCL